MYLTNIMIIQATEQFDDPKEVIRSCKSQKELQYICQKTKQKRNDKHWFTKLKTEM